MGKLAKRLVQPLRVRDDDSASEPYSDELGGSSRSPSILSTGSAGKDQGDDNESDEDIDEDEKVGESEDEPQEEVNVKEQLSKVSFGALAKAQDALIKANGGDSSRKRKRGEKESQEQEDKLELLRQRLRELKEAKGNTSQKGATTTASTKTTKPSRASDSDDDTSGDSDSDASSEDEGPAKRKSKHAPMSQSATKQVSRHRNAIPVPRKHTRDPRFDKLSGPPPDENALLKKYSFLNDYRKDEIATLKTTIKTRKDPTTSKKLSSSDLDSLKAELKKMEDKEREIKRSERAKEVLREHKKKEREAVKEGKKPFFLKESEKKKLALVDRFESMKGKQRDKAIERRRKKVTARERRNMPDFRRGAEA